MDEREPRDRRHITPEHALVLLETAVNPFVLMGSDGVVTWASESIEELLGHRADEVVGTQMLDLVAPESQADAVSALTDALTEREDERTTEWEGVGPVYTLLRADGSRVSCAVAVATPNRTGLDHFVLQLRRSDATAALERLHLSMGTGDPLGTVLTHLAAVLEGELPDADVILYHYDRLEERLMATTTRPTLADTHDLPAMVGDLWARAELAPGQIVNVSVDDLPAEVSHRAAGAGYNWLVLSAIERLTDDEERPAMVTVWSRAAHRTHMLNHERVARCGRLLGVALKSEWGRQALLWAATHDLLTGLPNQAAFENALADIQAGRRRTDRASVLYLDLDDFKPVNERYGHPLGDRVLMLIADRLRHVIRPTDLVARLGGDEFGVLCPGLDDPDVLGRLAARLVSEIRQPIELDGRIIQVGLSIGIASATTVDSLATVVTRADGALRRAKSEGKSRWEVAG